MKARVIRCDDRLTMRPVQKTAGFFHTDACHNAVIRVAVYRHGEGQYLYLRKDVYNIYTRPITYRRDSGPTSPGTSYASAREVISPPV